MYTTIKGFLNLVPPKCSLSFLLCCLMCLCVSKLGVFYYIFAVKSVVQS